MNSHDSNKIEELVALALDRIEERGPSAAEELYREYPEAADVLRERVEWLLETGLATGLDEPPREFPEYLGDFHLIEPIGKGGMGIVYRAQQISLGREVAVKLVRPENLYFPGARERFEREVTTVAALAHPGIVPVFSVGLENGVPFFAMEHVRGASLGDVIHHLRGRDVARLEGADLLRALDTLGADRSEDPSSLFEGPWPTVVARIGREVAEALEHAHRRGVLHRDVKPTNVMITRGGRVMLVDFGLSSDASTEERRTRTGQAVGTIAYMAPEQLRGERDLDARADVYALGVTLYEMLTLRLPHDASSDTARMSSSSRPLPADLRRTDPRVPWELETVIQTSGDPEPSRRYWSAADFARDLGNVLENKPIEARRASAWLRGKRWIQRHPASALALAVVVAGPTLFALQEMRANTALSEKRTELAASNTALQRALDDATGQRSEAERARARAEQAFDRAYEAIELMLSKVGGEVLEGVPRMAPIRRDLLHEALRLQEEMLASLEDPGGHGGSEPERELYAKTLQRAGSLRAQMGEFQAAREHMDEAAAVLDAYVDTSPEVERERGVLDYRRAQVARLLEEDEAALTLGQAAVERLAALHAQSSDALTTWGLVRARNELAEILTRVGAEGESRAQLEESVRLLNDLTSSGNATRQHRKELAATLHQMAGYPDRGVNSGPSAAFGAGGEGYDPQRGEAYLADALKLCEQLLAERPDDYSELARLAEVAQQLGGTHALGLQMVKAGAAYRRSFEAYRELAEAFPERPAYRDGLVGARVNLSLTVPPDERLALLEEAVVESEALLADNPDFWHYSFVHVTVLAQLGHARWSSGESGAVEPLYASLELGLPLLAGRARPDLRATLAWTVGILCAVLRERGDDPTAIVDAARIYQDVQPRPVEVAWGATFVASAVAQGQRSGIGTETLAAWTDEALGWLEGLVDSAPDDPAVKKELREPELGVFAGEERFLALLEAFGIDR